MANLLVVDWDYFFARPELGAPSTGDPGVDGLAWQYDWGHAETDFMVNGVWLFRAADLLNSNGRLPGTNGKWVSFWDRFTIAEGAPVNVADSNVWSGLERTIPGGAFEHVYLYDAHHDSGFQGETLEQFAATGTVTCENWTLAHVVAGTEPSNVHVRYPPWRSYAMEIEPAPGVKVDRAVDDEQSLAGVVFDAVSVCRSGAWVPPWLDGDFEKFLNLNPTGTWDEVHESGGFPVRDFDMGQVRAQAVFLGQAHRLREAIEAGEIVIPSGGPNAGHEDVVA